MTPVDRMDEEPILDAEQGDTAHTPQEEPAAETGMGTEAPQDGADPNSTTEGWILPGPLRKLDPAGLGQFKEKVASDRQYQALFVVTLLLLIAIGVFLVGGFGDDDPSGPSPNIYDPTTPGKPNDAMHTQADNQNEMSVAINPVNPLNMVAGANDYGCNPLYEDAWAGYYYTNDGGQTWDSGCIPGFPGDTSEEGLPLQSYYGAGDPVLVVDSHGRFYYAGIAFSRSPLAPSDIFVAISDDGGRTFGDIEIVSPPGTGMAVIFQDKEWIHVDPFNDNVYIAWAQFENYIRSRIMFARSTNGGANWEAPYAISGWFDGQQQHQGTALAVDGNGNVHVTWIDHAAARIVLKTSRDSGQTFEGALVTALPILDIDTIPREGPPNKSFRTPNLPQMAADHSGGPYDGSVYIVWNDDRDGDPDIMMGYSRDNGLSWDGPFKINEDPEGNEGAWQFFPSVTVTMTGEVWVMYYTTAYSDPADEYLLDIEYAHSHDGGQTFNSFRVTNMSIDGEAGGGSIIGENTQGDAFIGDYIEIDSGPEYVYGVWCDTRNGGPDPQQRNGDVYGAAHQWREL